jgi:hypothetical protein
VCATYRSVPTQSHAHQFSVTLWTRLPVVHTSVTRPMLAARIVEAAKVGERDPVRLWTHAIAGFIETALCRNGTAEQIWKWLLVGPDRRGDDGGAGAERLA